MTTRQASDFERGLLIGAMISSLMPNTLMLMIFCMIICYDLGRPRIIEVVQKMLNRMTGIDFESEQNQLNLNPINIQNTQGVQSYQNQNTQNTQNIQNPTIVQNPPNQQNVQTIQNPLNQQNLPIHDTQSNIKLSPSQPNLNLFNSNQPNLIPGALGFGLNLLNQQLSASTQNNN